MSSPTQNKREMRLNSALMKPSMSQDVWSLSCYNVSYRFEFELLLFGKQSGSNENNRPSQRQHTSEGRRVRKRLGLQRPINPPRGSLRRHHPPRRAHLRSGLLSLSATSQHIHYNLSFHRLELPVDSPLFPPFFLLPPTPNQRQAPL